MASGVDTDVGADKTVVPNGNRSLVQHREIEVGKEAFAHPDLFAVIAVERLVNADMVVANVPQQAFQDGAQLLRLRRLQGVVAVNHLLGGIELP